MTGTRPPFAEASFTIDGALGPIRGECRLPRESRGAVVLCHGFKGFARFAFFPWFAARCAGAGFAAITFDESGSGIGADRETFTELERFANNTYAAERHDLASVVAEGRRQGWITGRYGVMGHSRGGALALLHASDATNMTDVAALVTWAALGRVGRMADTDGARWREQGHLDVPNLRTGQVLRLGTALLDEIERERDGALDLVAAAARVRAPWLIGHGTADETVPEADARALHAATEGRAELLLLEGANHGFGMSHGMTTPSTALLELAERSLATLERGMA